MKSHVGSSNLVRWPESRSVRLSEVIGTIVISIRNTAFVRCREVVRFLEGPLWEVPGVSRVCSRGVLVRPCSAPQNIAHALICL